MKGNEQRMEHQQSHVESMLILGNVMQELSM